MAVKISTSFERMKFENLNTVFRTIIDRRPISRIEISQVTGLNKMTVTNCVKGLMEQGILVEQEPTNTPVGRPPIALELNPRLGIMVGVELNIISCKILMTEFDGKVLERKLVPDIGPDPDQFVEYIAQYIQKKTEQAVSYERGVLGIGIAIPGNYNYETGYVEYISNMLQWNGYPIREQLAQRLPELPIFIQNAGRAGSRGELEFGKSHAREDMTYVQGAMGLALSMYSNYRRFVGYRGFNGRFGHNIIEFNGRLCTCGSRGCLEMYASIHAICDALYPGQPVRDEMIQEILRRKADQDPEVQRVIGECIKYLAVGLANIANCFNPHRICIGNYLGMVLEGEEERLNREVSQYLLPCYQEDEKIFISKLQEWGAALGSVAAVRDSAISEQLK